MRKFLPIFALTLVASASFLLSPSLSRAQTTLSEEEQLAQMASLLQALQSVVNTLSAASGQSAQGVPPPPPPPPSPAGDGYFGEYWSTPSAGASPAIPTTAPTATRLDTSINFSWGSGSPMSSIPSDHFIVRWTKQQDFSGGDYLFSVNADDGVRLYIDDQLVINQWINQSATTYTAGRTLAAGTHTLRIEYYEAAGSATMQFSFTQTAVAPPVTPAPTVTLTANPTSITQGQSSTLTWSSTNATSCTASGGWTGTKTTSGTQAVSPTANTTYTLTCTGAGGSANQSVTVGVSANPAPTVTFTANPTSTTASQGATLSWSSTNATSCTASGGFLWTGSRALSGSQFITPESTTTFTLACTGAGGTTTKTATVTVVSSGTTSGQLSGSASVKASSQNTDLSSEGTTDWVHWGLSIPTSVNRKSGVTGQIGSMTTIGAASLKRYADDRAKVSWVGGTPTASTGSTPAGVYIKVNGSGYTFTVPADTTTRTLKIYLGAWNAQGLFQAFLNDNSASPYSVIVDAGSTGTATDRVITLTYKAASAGQSLTVRYTLFDDYGLDGNITLQAATLQGVSSTPAPTVTLTTNPTSITQGQSSTLTWSSTNATSCTASGGWTGTKTTSGTQAVSPTANTTYTLTCTGAGGSANQSVTVGVSAATAYNLVYSTSASRSNPAALNGAVVSGGIYVFLTPETNITGDVLFYIDNVSGSGTAYKTESNAPYDLAGTNTSNGSAAPYNTAQLSNGTHTVTVRLNTNTVLTSTFTVANSSSTPAPTVTLTTNPTSITQGQSSTLTWSSTNATSCTASGGWTGTKTTSGTQAVSPTANTTYTLTCTGAGGSANQSVTVGIELGYFGEYWDVPTAGASPSIPSTAPTFTRIDPAIDFDWTTNAPGTSVAADHFIVRWTRNVDFVAGTYRFTASSDDGVRVYVDNQLLINDWTNHGVRTYVNDLTLSAGSHALRIEYYENTGSAVAQFSFAPVTSTGSVDTQAPTVVMTSPSSGATVSGTVGISASAADDVGVVGVQFKLDGANLGPEDTSAPYAMSWDTTSAASGAHTINAVARDAAGNNRTSTGVSVTVNNLTAPPPPPAPAPSFDSQAPTISGITTSSITTSGAVISWTTNEATTQQVDYGLSASYGAQTSTQTSLSTSHSVTLSNLSPNTTYHFRVRSADAAGNVSVSLDQTLTTASLADTQGPNAITNVSVSDIRSNSATVTWTVPSDIPSGAPASYDLRYSTTLITLSNFSSRTQVAGEPTPTSAGATQTYTLAGLSPSTLYYVAIVSKDAAGNTSSISNVMTFTTVAETTTTTTSTNSGTNTSTSSGTNSGTSSSGGGGGGGVVQTIASPRNFIARGASNQILLSWSNPQDTEFIRVKIVRKANSVPSSSSDGTTVYEGTNQTFTDTNLSRDILYYYAAYSIDRSLRTSSAVYAQARLGQLSDAEATQSLTTTSGGVPTAPTAPSAPQINTGTVPTGVFTIGLQVGSRDIQVKQLQQLLNSLGFTVAENGAGSSGNETEFFGPATANAVARFQAENIPEVSPTDRGLVGPVTRVKLNSLASSAGLVSTTASSVSNTTSTQVPAVSSGAVRFTRNLKVGDRGSDVKDLQQALNSLGFTVASSGAGSSGNETEFFGPATADAVARFQEEYKQEVLAPYNLARGTGFFGASTRTKLNTLVGGEGSGAGDTAALIALLQAQLLALQAQLAAILSGQTTQVTVPSISTPIPTTPSAPTTSPDNSAQTSTDTSGDTTGSTSSDSGVPPPPPPPPPPAF